MVLCHAATKQRMLLPLQNSRRGRLRRDDAKNAGETAGKRKHERLRQGASGSPPIRGPANGATVPPSRSSANNITRR